MDGGGFTLKKTKGTLNNLVLITQFGISMMVPIFLCFFIGVYLDKWLQTSFIAILMFFVGSLAGFRNVYMFAKRSMKSDEEREDERDTKD